MCARDAPVAWAAWSCVVLAVASAASEIIVYKMVGDDVVFNTTGASAAGPGTVVWKHNHSLAMEFDGTDIESYRQFSERGTLDRTSGEMKLTGLTRSDSGLYTSDIEGVTTPDFRLIVIPPVPRPTVGTSCDEERASCTLTCDGDTADAGPVTHRWRRDDEWTTGSQALVITKEDSSGVGEFSCLLENPVSRMSSEPVTNPFSTTPGGKLNVSMGVTVFIALLGAVLLLVGVHRCKAGMWFFQKTSMPWEPNFWRKNERPPRDAAECNGTSAQERAQSDEETPLS
ncbi:T-lymphocyte surface antigen Ly-9-like [Clinocottus analis]|uniref:T-lymphocyte surface antigen Ly-9-like n=1 Tax=Clinocottus analis TaxID=304258 RepID=UPI0035C1C79A